MATCTFDEAEFLLSGKNDDTSFHAISYREGKHKATPPTSSQTQTFIEIFYDLFDRFMPKTPQVTQTVEDIWSVEGFEQQASVISTVDPSDTGLNQKEFDRIISNRVVLLARQYVVGDENPENDARLAIFTERLRKVLPPVTDDEWNALNEVAKQIDDSSNRHIDILKEIGLAKCD